MSSGNSLDFTKDELALFEAHGVAVKEMEAAAIAWAAHLYGTPTFTLKSITDIVDGARSTPLIVSNIRDDGLSSFLNSRSEVRVGVEVTDMAFMRPSSHRAHILPPKPSPTSSTVRLHQRCDRDCAAH